MIMRVCYRCSCLIVLVGVCLLLSLTSANRALAVDTLLGDVNLNASVNGLDANPFVNQVVDDIYQAEADCDQDGSVNGLDADQFVAIVVGGEASSRGPGLSNGNVFFSTVGSIGGGAALGDPDIILDPGESLTLYLWSTDDQDYDTSIGMNVVSDTPGVIAFTGASVEEPELLSLASDPPVPSGMLRWNAAAVGVVDPNIVERMNAVSLGPIFGATGIVQTNDGTAPPFKLLDPLWDIDAGAFLLGSVSMDAVGLGETALSINQDGTAFFVNQAEQMFPTFGTATITVPVTVLIDIKPGSDHNAINLGSNGVVPVAIFGTNDFDVTTVDPLTVTLAQAEVRLRGRGEPMTSLDDLNMDGFTDLVLHMETQGFELTGTDIEAWLTGETFDGIAFSGMDSIRIVPPSNTQGIPEPSTFILAALGLLGLVGYTCRQQKHVA